MSVFVKIENISPSKDTIKKMMAKYRLEEEICNSYI